MLKTASFHYYKFFDETLSNGTIIVLGVTMLIFLVGIIAPGVYAENVETLQLNAAGGEQENIVIINGEEYKVIFSKITK